MIKIYCRTPIVLKKYYTDDLGRRITTTGSGGPEIVNVKGRFMHKERRVENDQGEFFKSQFSVILPSLQIRDLYAPGSIFTIDLTWMVLYQGIEWPIRVIQISQDFRDRKVELFL